MDWVECLQFRDLRLITRFRDLALRVVGLGSKGFAVCCSSH